MARLVANLITLFSFSLSARLTKSGPREFEDRIAKPDVKFQVAKGRYEGREAAERAKKLRERVE